MQKAFLTPFLRGSDGSWTLMNVRTGRPLAHHLVGAFDSRSRRTGLLGKAVFEEGHAMIIAPTSAIHTFFMRFPIDVAFVARDGRVVGVRNALRPWRIAFAVHAHAVIELPAGTLAHSQTIRGDILTITATS